MKQSLVSVLHACALDGAIIDPEHADYPAARRVWNGMADRLPAAIVRAETIADVQKVVVKAAERGVLLAVRGGGHSLPGFSTCDDGIVLDLSRMNAIAVDPAARTAEAQGGALLGDLDKACVPLGLAVPAGVVSHTGVAGLTLGGGMGWLSRRLGLTIDSLTAAEIVTADGTLHHASADSEPDLFWAIRGGGGNFGVVTKFQFRAHDLGSMLIGSWIYPAKRARAVLQHYGELAAQAPRQLGSGFILTSSELLMTAVWSGPPSGAEAAVAPYGKLDLPVSGSVGTLSFLDLQTRSDENLAWHRRYYTKGGNLAEIDSAAIDRIVEGIETAPSAAAEYYILQLGGAVADLDEDATPYSGRKAGHFWIAQAAWDRPEEDRLYIDWTKRAAGALSEISMQGNYVNEQADSGEEVTLGAYGPSKYRRLAGLKARYDPANLFRLNQNIEPRDDSRS